VRNASHRWITPVRSNSVAWETRNTAAIRRAYTLKIWETIWRAYRYVSVSGNLDALA